jgi:hypothetical protein
MTADSLPAPTGGHSAAVGDAHELLRQYLAIYDSYHNHKEMMAYVVTALYLGGAAALLVAEPLWEDRDRTTLVLMACFLVLVSVLAFLFVRHQLLRRRSAGDMFKACACLASRWLSSPPDAAALEPDSTPVDPVLFDGFVLPRALREELEAVQDGRTIPWWPRDLTYTAMLGAGLLVLLRIVLTWPGW